MAENQNITEFNSEIEKAFQLPGTPQKAVIKTGMIIHNFMAQLLFHS